VEEKVGSRVKERMTNNEEREREKVEDKLER
jgi:hypothetical protein